MMVTLKEQKRLLRKEKTALRRAIGAEERFIADHAIVKALESIPELQESDSLVAYASDGTEPDLSGIMLRFLESGKNLILPRFSEDGHYDLVLTRSLALRVGKWGIPEPDPEAEICPRDLLRNSCWLVPGVAFDASCSRLGRGKGIYDRLLAEENHLAIGVFYECQKCDAIPKQPHDMPLSMVVTEQRIYRRII